MTSRLPLTDLESRFSSDHATPTPWSETERALETAEVFWLSTVRPDQAPHVTPLIGIWAESRFHFCTGVTERKASNLSANPRCVVTTGCNALGAGIDIVVEGMAIRVRDEVQLQRLADAYDAKYEGWHVDVRNAAFYGDGGEAWVYEVNPLTAFAFAKGDSFAQTRYRF